MPDIIQTKAAELATSLRDFYLGEGGFVPNANNLGTFGTVKDTVLETNLFLGDWFQNREFFLGKNGLRYKFAIMSVTKAGVQGDYLVNLYRLNPDKRSYTLLETTNRESLLSGQEGVARVDPDYGQGVLPFDANTTRRIGEAIIDRWFRLFSEMYANSRDLQPQTIDGVDELFSYAVCHNPFRRGNDLDYKVLVK